MRVLVFGAGGPAGINVVRSLAEAGHSVIGADSNAAHLPWAGVYCDDLIVAEDFTVEEINGVGADAVHSQAEGIVWWIAHYRQQLDAATLCPSAQVVTLSQDKWEACLMFRRAELRVDKVHLVQDQPTLNDAAEDLGYPFWLRARQGAGARGSALCESWQQAISWVRYWWARDSTYDFIAEQYLPGRDLAWTSLWRDGVCFASFGRERLEYIYPKLAPSGRTGTPTIARTIHDDELNKRAFRAVLALDHKPHGFYSVDLREDADGVPRPTEVNAGRCFTTSYLSTAAGFNFMDAWCTLIEGKDPRPKDSHFNVIPAGLTWMRHIDCPELLLAPNGAPVLYEGMPENVMRFAGIQV